MDDLIIMYDKNEKTVMTRAMNQLSKKLKLKELGVPKTFLKIKVTKDNDAIYLTQDVAVGNLIKLFELEDAKTLKYPMNINASESSEDYLDDLTKYRSIIGGLSYLSLCTRPDISTAVSTLAQYSTKPTLVNFNAAKGILRYLNGTKCMGLKFNINKKNNIRPLDIKIYTDADFANGKDRKSRSGIVTFIDGNLIDWSSNKQQSVSLSTCEAEYIAMCAGAQRAKWISQLLNELGIDHNTPILYVDNQSAKNMAVNDCSTRRTKHIDIRAHFVREMIHNKLLKIEYVGTNDMLADIFTKNLVGLKFTNNRDKLISIM